VPFIDEQRRQPMLDGILKDPQPGDWCFKYYKPMVDEWRKRPGWTTAQNIYRESIDVSIEHQMAWQVFFQIYVMPYEYKRREENGDIK